MPDYVVVTTDSGPEKYRIISDYLGSPRLVVKQDGTIMERSSYDAWGNRTSSDVIGSWWRPIPFGFAGGLEDRTTGLLRFGAREYDPRTGRWLARDPVGLAGGANLYSYAGNDPVNYVDVDGRSPFFWMALLSGVANGGANLAWQAVLVSNGVQTEIDIRKVITATGTGFIQAGILGLNPNSGWIFNAGLGAAIGAAQSVFSDLFLGDGCGNPNLDGLGQRMVISAGYGALGGLIAGSWADRAGLTFDPVKFPREYARQLSQWNLSQANVGRILGGSIFANAQGF